MEWSQSLKIEDVFTYLKWILRCGLEGDYLLGTEMAFWDIELNKRRPEGWKQEFFAEDILPVINMLKNVFNEKIKIVELGSGPVSRLSKLHNEDDFILIGIDPLADKYKKYLGSQEFIIQGYGEKIDEILDENSFHLAYASNVLDHSKDPVKCFDNLIRLLVSNGIIVVQGNVKEGSRTGWSGLHKHDLYVENNDLWCTSKKTPPVCLSDRFNLNFVIKREILFNGNPWFSITYQKN